VKPVAALVAAAALLALASAWVMGALDHPPVPPPTPARYRQAMARVDRFLEARSGGGSRTAGGWTWVCHARYLGAASAAPRVRLDVWEVCQEYHARGGRLEQLTGWSVPAVVTLARTRAGLRPVAEAEPGDAPDYARDVQRLFPAGLDGIIARLEAGYGVRAVERVVTRRARRELLGRS
jgi:hypothetical protein